MHIDSAMDSAADPEADRQFKAAVRGMWALGDYHQFATRTVWQMGAVLTAACGIRRGQRVLDVAAGSGNTALRAAETGADVIATDLTPENFHAGRRAAAEADVELQWLEADAEALPFPDADFDVVTSSFGAMFAPHHQAVADEMVRVCRRGGTIGMINFRPTGLALRFFELLGRYLPPPPSHARPPLLWGDESHVRALFADRVDFLELRRGEYVETSDGPEQYRTLFETAFGPVIAVRALLADEPERLEEFDAEFRAYTAETARSCADGSVQYPYDYLLIVARRR